MERGQDEDARFLFKSADTEVKLEGLVRAEEKNQALGNNCNHLNCLDFIENSICLLDVSMEFRFALKIQKVSRQEENK